jgi:hypothetical protein
MLLKKYVRDGSRPIIGSITSGYTSAVARDEHNRITGRSNERFQTTRDAHDKLVSIIRPTLVSSLAASNS